MAKEEAKAGAAGGGAAEAAKPPMFSKAGLMVLVGAVAVSGGVAALLTKGGSGEHAAGAPESAHANPPEHPSAEVHNAPSNKVVLEPMQGKYRDTGSTRRSFSLTVVLEVRADADPAAGEHADKATKALAEEDAKRKKSVEAEVDWIKDKIYDILRGKGPEDFATNEMVEQVKQQIKRAINDEKFDKKPVIVGVLFPEQSF